MTTATPRSLPVIDLAPLTAWRRSHPLALDHELVLGDGRADDGLAAKLIDLATPLAQQLHRAFKDTGFAYISHHGVAQELIDALVADARRFFASPIDEKKKLAMIHAGRAWRGFFAVGDELTAGAPDQKEGLYLGTEHPPDAEGVLQGWPMHGHNLWPEESTYPNFREHILRYLDELTALGHDLMMLVALGLGLPADYFRKRFSHEPTTLLRIFNYPKQPEVTELWGVGQHTDMGFLTILLQDELGGLQVHAKDGQWIDAPPLPGTFVINIGDMLQHWTHGIYKASLHRVRNVSQRDRLSIPFFFDPAWTCKLTPTDKALLPQDELQRAAQDPHRARWDGLDMTTLPTDITYGDFVWSKIKDVFPELADATQS